MAGFSDTRIAAILRGSLAFRDYDYPGHPEVKVALRLLSDTELDDCRIQALVEMEERAKKRKWDLQLLVELDPDFHDRAVERQIVWRSFFDPETTKKEAKDAKLFFSSYTDIAALGSVEQRQLLDLYLEHQRWVAPLRSADAEEVDAFIEALGKVPSVEVFLAGFEPKTLVRWVISLVRRLSSSPTNKSSST